MITTYIYKRSHIARAASSHRSIRRASHRVVELVGPASSSIVVSVAIRRRLRFAAAATGSSAASPAAAASTAASLFAVPAHPDRSPAYVAPYRGNKAAVVKESAKGKPFEPVSLSPFFSLSLDLRPTFVIQNHRS